ncbi:BadM/Rrf2 family transcriptional regulator [Nocardioides albertanoniae]|uniref:BadM/Rrf2 family transcriptional regulator n=1 Tax=Nocardioides albertanoniae TaxID=1175486 RepID=A0A543A5D6_9ACTN|nr:Rrf2 family transcriptional regulator [Nocardioides albertanoniae]TQL67768.1 BadM/Rrf2 family transcriptional regulator [Nocardioides albertanoniae]
MATPTNTRFAVAVHVLTYLASCAAAGRTTPVGSEELAGSTAVNPVHVRKVLGPLRAAGLVSSWPGARGGWELAADPEVVDLAQVWRVLQGDDPVLGIHGPNPACAVGANIQGVLTDLDRRVARAVLAELEAITLADVLASAGFRAEDYAALLR